jgi:hypothetical protein
VVLPSDLDVRIPGTPFSPFSFLKKKQTTVFYFISFVFSSLENEYEKGPSGEKYPISSR